jgi:hypothetical protein
VEKKPGRPNFGCSSPNRPQPGRNRHALCQISHKPTISGSSPVLAALRSANYLTKLTCLGLPQSYRRSSLSNLSPH